jgi:hypothetical protein
MESPSTLGGACMVGDRDNDQVEIYDENGKYLNEWRTLPARSSWSA